jgi:trans-aconitate 2-methyltransferase
MNESVPARKAHGAVAQSHGLRAAQDLMSRIPALAPRRIAEVFSGQASMRPLLAQQFPEAEIEAFDLSQRVQIAQLRSERTLSQLSDGRLPAKGKFDLIVSNGSLELLPSLPRLLPVLVARLAAGGCLAFHIPNDLYEPSRALVRMIAADGPWAGKLLPIAKTRPFNESMEHLYALLSPIVVSLDIWEATYLHVMNDIAAIVELMEGTRLAPFLAPLGRADRRKFLARYAAELEEAYPALPDGAVLLRIRRLFVVARA